MPNYLMTIIRKPYPNILKARKNSKVGIDKESSSESSTSTATMSKCSSTESNVISPTIINVQAKSVVNNTSTPPAPQAKLCCDKCDGPHETNSCPYYKKNRDSHPDAQKNAYKKLGGLSNLPGAVLRNARVVRQPGDGSCLFHSMSYGLKDGSNANSLRRDICAFIENNPKVKIADTPLCDWVKWDSSCSTTNYVRKMSRGAWGGGIEMACTSLMRGVNIHVYERSSAGYVRISAFDHPDRPEERKVVRVLYCGGVHYDALVG